MKIIKVGNGTSDYPGNFTKKEIQIIKKNMVGETLHLFSGRSHLGGVRIDFSCDEANYRGDVFKLFESDIYFKTFKTVIIDAPYNQKFADKYQKIGNTPKQFVIFADTQKTTLLFNYINKINPEIIILKSWNYYCLKRYKIKECYVCYPGGYRKSTFLIIMKRKQKVLL